MRTPELILSGIRCLGQLSWLWEIPTLGAGSHAQAVSGEHRHWELLGHSGLPAQCPGVIPAGKLGALGHREVMQPLFLGKVP